jgi:hypothetical protein
MSYAIGKEGDAKQKVMLETVHMDNKNWYVASTTAVLLGSLSKMMRFLDSCSWVRITFSVPLMMK